MPNLRPGRALMHVTFTPKEAMREHGSCRTHH
jgi:hypothetical protein